MLCTFCGTENHQEHKFCGMCGVRLERRQTDRRVNTSGISLKCSSCNHVNDAGLKFCGMCGTRVERRMQERRASGDGPRAAAIANAQLPTPDSRSTGATLIAEPPKRSDDVLIALPRRGEPTIFRNDPVSESIPPPKTTSVRESFTRQPLGKEPLGRDRRIPAKESNISGP
ncbi:MAG TPA: zinc ribbon domain-containing protein, partial [Candidatus Angelobacter sp.]|nr:zinc ribbon domain-containing protein [Candidatus Angelobacter sp.]